MYTPLEDTYSYRLGRMTASARAVLADPTPEALQRLAAALEAEDAAQARVSAALAAAKGE